MKEVIKRFLNIHMSCVDLTGEIYTCPKLMIEYCGKEYDVCSPDCPEYIKKLVLTQLKSWTHHIETCQEKQ